MSNLPPPPSGGDVPPPGGPPPSGPPPSGPPPGGGGGFPPPGGGSGPPPGTPGPLAEWQDRLVSGLIDYIAPFIVAQIVSFAIGYSPTDFGTGLLLGWVIFLFPFGWALYMGYMAGETGQSIGMKQSGLRLVGEQTGQPIGSNQGVVRNLLLLPGFFCCGLIVIVDALFPLWDPKKQTLRDKIAKSVVIKSA